jgi:protein-L-isoaspartate(D-aspartate) O-methyltransferase
MKPMQQLDTYRHRGLRRDLINGLREKGIKDERVLAAMERVPRHFFLDSAFDHIAYEDRAFPIKAGQTISQPFTVAYQTELLQVKPGQKVMEIGTGSAYQAAVLHEMGVWLLTIERQEELYQFIKDKELKKIYPRIRFHFGDGFAGYQSMAPFDRILITAAAPFVPPRLIDQLAPGGIIVLPLNDGNQQRMTRITKLGLNEVAEEKFEYFSFVPMLQGKT